MKDHKFFKPNGQRTQPGQGMGAELAFPNDSAAYSYFAQQDEDDDTMARMEGTMNADQLEQFLWGSRFAQNSQAGEVLAMQGRGTDDQIAHLTTGETMIPPEVLERNPELGAAIRAAFESMGANPNEFVIGHPDQKINPITGQPEFGLGKSIKKAFKKVKNVVGKVLGNPITAGIATVATAGALAPFTAGALGTGLLGTIGNTALASTGLNLASGNSLGNSLIQGGISGATAGIGGAAAGAAGKAGANVLSDGVGSTTLGSLLESSGIPGALNSTGLGSSVYNALSTAAGDASGNVLEKAIGGVLSTNIGQYASAASTGLGANPNLALASEVPYSADSSTPQNKVSVGTGPDATGSNQGAGNVPYQPSAVDALSGVGVSYINPVGNRDTGEIDYVNSPFNNSIRNVRRGTWGGSILTV